MGASAMLKTLYDSVTYEPVPGNRVPWYSFPFKNRWCRLIWYSIIVFSTTLVYYGWQQFSQMLFLRGAYIWKCAADEQVVSNSSACTAQDNAVQTLYTVGLASEFIIGLAAGISLDHLGPLLTGLIGETLFFCGWMMMVYSTQAAQLFIPGMICLAGAVNMIAFPVLILGDFFPKRSGLAISFVIACQTAGTAIAPILKAVWDKHPAWTYSDLIWGYLLTVWLPCTILAVLSLPVLRPALLKKKLAAKAAEDADLAVAEAKSEGHRRSNGDLSNGDLSNGDLSNEAVPSFAVDISNSGKAVWDEKSLWRLYLTVEFLVFTCYYILQLFQFGYYPTTVLDHFGDKISDFQGNVMPTQAVWGVLFGLLVDHTGTLPICFGLLTTMILVYVLALIKKTNLQYLTSMLFVVSNSYIYTVKYTYVTELFPETHFGILVGTVGFFGGLFTLLNIPIQNARNYSGTCVAYIIVGCAGFLLIGFLVLRKKRGHSYKDPIAIEVAAKKATTSTAKSSSKDGSESQSATAFVDDV